MIVINSREVVFYHGIGFESLSCIALLCPDDLAGKVPPETMPSMPCRKLVALKNRLNDFLLGCYLARATS
jgi:hypothetical protein